MVYKVKQAWYGENGDISDPADTDDINRDSEGKSVLVETAKLFDTEWVYLKDHDNLPGQNYAVGLSLFATGTVHSMEHQGGYSEGMGGPPGMGPPGMGIPDMGGPGRGKFSPPIANVVNVVRSKVQAQGATDTIVCPS